MKVVAVAGRDDVALVYLAERDDGRMVEFTESLQPPLPREQKWVLTVSTLDGCPVRCRMCDAGGTPRGRLSVEDILSQIDIMIRQRFPDGRVPVRKFKIQFARMGEPALNPHVLDALQALPKIYEAPGFIPSLSSVAPAGTEDFFEKLLRLKKEIYPRTFQLQFSIHTTDQKLRDWLIPVRKWPLQKIAEYGIRFREGMDKKITLNFALAENQPVDPDVLLRCFSPDAFLMKITPVNPTFQAIKNRITSLGPEAGEVAAGLERAGYEVRFSPGEPEENRIGSNCGMYVTEYRRQRTLLAGSYTYGLRKVRPDSATGRGQEI
jgi:23S rRNA (adenine2503-C2)-methyltransferase